MEGNKTQRSKLNFPKSFLWGASTSAHQVEGGNHNQWSVWELENAKSLAARAEYQFGDLESWERVKKSAKDPENYVSGKAAKHYERYEADHAIARRMGLGAWRFSIEWSRVQPEEGAWNVAEVQYYKAYLASLKKNGLEPVVTLFHFTLPVWFAEKGGFEKRGNVKYFLQFVDRIMDEIGASARYIITLNEPEVYVFQSYLQGDWPPQKRSKLTGLRVLGNLAYAHNRAADIIHRKNRRYRVSVAKNSVFFYPGDDSWLSVRSSAVAQYLQDDYFLKKVVKSCDFIGVNYYMSMRVYGYRGHNPNERISDLGWDMQPDNLSHVLERLYEKYKKPLFITENGLADGEDADRKWWLAQSILAMQAALDKEVELIGYLHWSFIDNFEWDKGFWPRFGLVEVDYKTYDRKPRPSAVYYANLIKKIRGK